VSEDDRTYAEILGPARVTELLTEAQALADLIAVVEDYAASAGLSPLEAFEQLVPILRMAFTPYVPLASDLPC
jgi:hypothetical protein